MTSLERRREGRYQRRKAAREAQKAKLYGGCDDFNNIIRYRSLKAANQKSMRNVCWKASVQRYQMNLLRNMEETRSKLEAEKDITKGFVEFDVRERGRMRHIRSIHYTERVVQRSACDNSLVPLLSRGLIYDNGACLEGKGVDKAMERLKAHLQQFYRADGNSNQGVAVLFDFSHYFDEILHSECFNTYSKTYRDRRILWLLHTFVTPFGYPMANTDFKRVKQPLGKGEYTGKSLGLGSQISQITAVAYPSRIDHYIKQVLRVRWYGRYMDDGYMLFKTKAEAKAAVEALIAQCEKLGIKVNRKKTKIVPIQRGIKFLKALHYLTPTGKVKRRMARESITRQRRKLRKFAVKIEAGEMTVQEARNAYASWKGYALHRGGTMAVRKMDKKYKELIKAPAPIVVLKNRRKKPWQTAKTQPIPLPRAA